MQRRKFLKTTAAAGAGAFVVKNFSIGKEGPSANSKANIAMIGGGGIAGMAFGSLRGENIVAVCDVDSTRNKRGNAKSFTDFRVMLDKMHKEIDGVCVNTPDHTHFAATMATMEHGLHVCTQKPLSHNIWQARVLREAAKKYNVITNMGNQGHTYNGIRQMREWYEAGAMGDIKEIHCGINGPGWRSQYFGKPGEMPLPKKDIPANLNWDLWIGPQKMVDYNPGYHPLKWRSFWDFGTGMLGDWFCHIGDGPVWILDLYDPTTIECTTRKENLPGVITDHGVVKWTFPKRGKHAPCTMSWFDGMGNGGQNMKAPDGWGYGRAPQKGSYWYGTKHDGYLDERSNNPKMAKRDIHTEVRAMKVPEKYPRIRVRGPHDEWAKAIKGGPTPGATFEYSSRLTETCLLGVLAQRFGGKIEWDAKKMKITNRKELNVFVKEPTRDGWSYGEKFKVYKRGLFG